MNPVPSGIPSAIEAQSRSYTSSFFAGTANGSLTSARLLLGLLFEIHRPKSVLDVGCGQGTWLAAAEELGATKLAGFDGPWVNQAALLSNKIAFTPVNLEAEFAPSERFDLCISVEVAEHLAPKCAGGFVRSLCAASDVVVFSAAIRQQGGVMHVNEQWQSYWAQLFEAAGYDCHDLFRPQLWTDRRVESWYRQNVLLYVKRTHPVSEKLRARSTRPVPLDLVHPEIYEGNLESYQKAFDEPTFRLCCQTIGRWGRRQFRKLSSPSK